MHLISIITNERLQLNKILELNLKNVSVLETKIKFNPNLNQYVKKNHYNYMKCK